jgi:hypothetical protein
MDCFVASAFARRRASADKRTPRNDEWRHSFAISPHVFAQGIRLFPALSNQRAQGRPGARCTRDLVCKIVQKVRTRAYRFSGDTPAFPAQWLDGLYRALPGDRACLTPSPSGSWCGGPVGLFAPPQDLTPTAEASGPHDFAVRLAPFVSVPLIAHRSLRTRPAITFHARRCRVHRIPSRVNDDHDTPLKWVGTAQDID